MKSVALLLTVLMLASGLVLAGGALLSDGIVRIERTLTRREDILTQREVLAAGACVVAGLSIAAFVLTLRSIRQTKKQNRFLITQIKELQQYRERLLREKKPQAGTKPAANQPENKDPVTELFYTIDRRMRSEKLYLNSALTREDVIKLLGVRRNDFIRAVNEGAGMSFTEYLNGLRLEEALLLLGSPVAMTLENVALHSGFGATRSFYRQFKDKYKMSASEYRKLMRQ